MIKVVTITVLFMFSAFSSFAALLPVDADIRAARELVQRIMPQHRDLFIFRRINAPSKKDIFELSAEKGKVVVGGNNANAFAVGINYYLKYYCHASISWYRSDSLYLPAKMPAVDNKVRKESRTELRFFLNYCTFGYTMPWWTWKDWEWFIDWMALNGVNTPLAITGQEAVWYEVWKKFGLTDDEIRNYFTGPAFLPWHRMANIDHWQGPLPLSWLKNQLTLQKRIVSRERELGMHPVLPAFAGHVPLALKKRYPMAKIHSLGEWGSFDKKYAGNFLDPFDPLFGKIQHEFLTQQTRLFGTDHIYGADPFNEVTPPSWEPTYLASVSKTIFASMAGVDPRAEWLQMGWIFYYQKDHWTSDRIKAFLNAVPRGKMILLDYYCDQTEIWPRTEKFYQQPFVWCYLGNFGGNTMLAGDLKEVEKRLENSLVNGQPTIKGIGSTLEGFDMNPVMYEYVLEKAWSDGPVDLNKWINQWADRRAGSPDSSARKAWDILLSEIYTRPVTTGQGTLSNARPTMEAPVHWTTKPDIPYDNKHLLQAWKYFLSAHKAPLPSVYAFDVINTGRQVLGNYFSVVKQQFADAYKANDLNILDKTGDQMLMIIKDMDTLLSAHPSLLLGKWVADATSMAASPTEKPYYQEDALRILTTWGQKGSELNDYANRSWAGLMKDYYYQRWKMFIDEAKSAVQQHLPFNTDRFEKKIEAFEWTWPQQSHQFLNTPSPDWRHINMQLYKKYEPLILSE